ncbi:MAG: hypothetical protein ABJG88_06485 [Litorimonas sp.]
MIDPKKYTKGLLCATALTAFSSTAAFAQVTPNNFTPAGTSVSNTFTLDYSVGNVPQPPIDSSDPNDPNGPTLFTVDRLVNLTVESDGDTTVAPGSINQDLVFSVLNTGNDTQGYALSIIEETAAPDTFDTDVPTNATPITYFIDDGNGVFEPNAGDGAPITYDPANPPQLAPDAVIFVVIEQDIPTGSTDGLRAEITLVADSLDAGTTTPTVGDSDGNTLVGGAENVLADGTSTANENANEGDDSATGAYIVASADIEAIKTVSVFSEDGSNCATIPGAADADAYSIPGACVEYVIEVTNEGTAVATDIVVNDTLPDELEFTTAVFGGDFTGGSFNSPTLPGAGTDCGAPSGSCVVNLTGATLPAPSGAATSTSGTVTIRAIVK